MTRVNTLTEIWNTYNDNIISEKSSAREKAAKSGNMKGGLPGNTVGKGPVELNSKQAQDMQNKETTETDQVEGIHEPIDPKKSKKENAYEPKIYSSENYDKKIGKKVKESINNYMKSTFDKLFENVMSDEEQQELEALGVDTEEGGDDEGSDEITVTLNKDMAKQLCDILQAAIGDEDPEAEDMEHEDMEHEDGEHYEMEEDEEDGEDEDEDETHKEAVDATDEGHPLVNQKRGNPTSVTGGSNQVKSVVSSKAKKGKGGKNSKPKITSYSVNDEGHPLVNQKDSGLSKVSPGSNKVAYSAGEDYYQSN